MAAFNQCEELCFKTLITEVLTEMRRRNPSIDDQVVDATFRITDSFKSKTYMEINFDELHLIAYFYKWGALNIGVSRYRFSLAFQNCTNLKSLLSSDSLRAVSLGGGPGTDVVGFLSAMWDYLGNSVPARCPLLDFETVDLYEGWRPFHEYIHKLLATGNAIYGNAAKIFGTGKMQSFTFRNFDLRKFIPQSPSSFSTPLNPYELEFIQKLGNADIVLLVRVLTIIENGNQAMILQGIVNTMKKGALLLYVDTTPGLPGDFSSTLVELPLPPQFQYALREEYCPEKIFGEIFFATSSISSIHVYQKI